MMQGSMALGCQGFGTIREFQKILGDSVDQTLSKSFCSLQHQGHQDPKPYKPYKAYKP